MSFAYQISAFNRRHQWQRFVELFQPTSALRVLDVGYSDEEYSETDNFLEKHYRWPEQITALGIETPNQFWTRYPQPPLTHCSVGNSIVSSRTGSCE